VREASNRGALIFCSTADLGNNSHERFFPADLSDPIAVSAVDDYGRPLPQSSLSNADILMNGDKIVIPDFDGICDDDEIPISGSSVATALTAGVASLCLTLARLADRDGRAESLKNRRRMMAVFEKMTPVGSKFIIPPILLEHVRLDNNEPDLSGVLPLFGLDLPGSPSDESALHAISTNYSYRAQPHIEETPSSASPRIVTITTGG
jgi:hypothetical protein